MTHLTTFPCQYWPGCGCPGGSARPECPSMAAPTPFTDASAAPFLIDTHALDSSDDGRELDTYPHGWWIGALALVMAFVAGAVFGRVW